MEILFDIAGLEKELQKLEEKTSLSEFWNDSKNSEEVLKKITSLKKKTENYKKIKENIEDTEALNLLIIEESSAEEIDENNQYYAEAKEIVDNIVQIEKNLEKLEINTLLSGKYDANNAILTLHPGAGGTEAQDWVEMLYRMYTRWATSNGYEVKELDYLEGDEAGIKSVTFLVSGEYAYGYLKGEMGVHRLVRISPFDANKRRHTSFASVEVTPVFDDNIDVKIDDNDLRIDIYRSSGPGGQGVNTTDSAVRITHIPTGIVVTCQNERSQIRNKEMALEILKNKLYNLELEEKNKQLNDIKKGQMTIGFGSAKRSYVMCPYTLVKDNDSGYESSNVMGILDGDIGEMLEKNIRRN